ncbi:MAG TPA: hypothetical protein VFB12_18400 [Ktedonobacteraceae bacterium]|nr:hypothetical protein [Ktedonobacteraceae bacterium]
MLETLTLLLGLWLLFLLVVIYALLHSPHGSLGRFREAVSEHLSADGRAKALLREMLSESQYQQLMQFGYLEVESPSLANRIYRIPRPGGLVTVYEGGCAVMELCLHQLSPCQTTMLWLCIS